MGQAAFAAAQPRRRHVRGRHRRRRPDRRRSPASRAPGRTTTTTDSSTCTWSANSTAKRPDPRNRGRLYHNNGDGTFTDVAATAGVLNERWGKGAAWGDYDNDGDPDLYVSNIGEPNRLYRNDGDGTFTDVAPELGVTEPMASFACWCWDYDNDGRLDLFVCDFGNSLGDVIRSQLGQPTAGERPRLFHNEWPSGFRDVTTEARPRPRAGLHGLKLWRSRQRRFPRHVPGDGPGRVLATSIPKVLFKNIEGRRFEDVTMSSGTGHLQKGHGVAFADWDRDGDLDLFLEAGGATPGDRAHNVLFQNPGHGNHWLDVRLIGTRTNRAAIGARVRVDLRLPGGGAGLAPPRDHQRIELRRQPVRL